MSRVFVSIEVFLESTITSQFGAFRGLSEPTIECSSSVHDLRAHLVVICILQFEIFLNIPVNVLE